jgi:hypothetical protein
MLQRLQMTAVAATVTHQVLLLLLKAVKTAAAATATTAAEVCFQWQQMQASGRL